MRCRWIAIAGLVAACGPRVDPQAPFDEDDPRAGTPPTIDAGVATPDATAVAIPGPGLRATAISRAALVGVLDAGPGELLRGLEVNAVRPDGRFAGWQLVRLVGAGRRFAVLDLVAGDVLTTINGHTLESPPDLAALWAELRTATAIDATLVRGTLPFSIHADVTP